MMWLAAAPLAVGWLVWRERAPLPLARGGYAAAALDKHLVIAGGTYWQDGTKHWSARTDVFDPSANVWKAGPEMPERRGNGACATLNGSLYVIGGTVDGAISGDVRQLERGAWKKLAWALPRPLDLPIATAVGESIYVVGGLTKANDLTTATADVWRGTPGQGWKAIAPFPGTPRVTAAITSHQGKVYVFGGVDGQVHNLGDAWSYDPGTDRWRKLADPPVKRRGWGAVARGESIFLLGGYGDAFSAEVYAYDPAADTYQAAGTLPHPIADAKFVTIGGKLYSSGGEPEMKVRAAWTVESSEE